MLSALCFAFDFYFIYNGNFFVLNKQRIAFYMRSSIGDSNAPDWLRFGLTWVGAQWAESDEHSIKSKCAGI